MHLIPFQVSFVNREPAKEDERPVDLYFKAKIAAELPGILAWLVRGCLAYQARGLDPPTIVKDATSDYRRDEDLLADWVDDICFQHPDAKTGVLRVVHELSHVVGSQRQQEIGPLAEEVGEVDGQAVTRRSRTAPTSTRGSDCWTVDCRPFGTIADGRRDHRGGNGPDAKH